MFYAGAVVWKRAGTDLFDAFASVVRAMWEYGVKNQEDVRFLPYALWKSGFMVIVTSDTMHTIIYLI
jgi:hypothetical protein